MSTVSTLTDTEQNVIDNARMSNKALEIALEALLAIGLHRESLEGRRAIEAVRKIRTVMQTNEEAT